MVDLQTVCCMCGDVGFPDKLFRCTKCCDRFQHSYCSNYYDESTAMTAGFCDWCLSEEKSTSSSTKHGGVKKSSSAGAANSSRSEYSSSGDHKIKQNDHLHHREEISSSSSSASEKGKNTSGGGTPSPKPTGRRYKFLKDVMC